MGDSTMYIHPMYKAAERVESPRISCPRLVDALSDWCEAKPDYLNDFGPCLIMPNTIVVAYTSIRSPSRAPDLRRGWMVGLGQVAIINASMSPRALDLDPFEARHS